MECIDRIDFTKSLSYGNFETDIINFFDQIMALYDLVGKYTDMDISTETDQTSSIKFILLTDNDDEANLLYNALSGRIIPIYGHTYIAELTKLNNSLTVILSEEASG